MVKKRANQNWKSTWINSVPFLPVNNHAKIHKYTHTYCWFLCEWQKLHVGDIKSMGFIRTVHQSVTNIILHSIPMLVQNFWSNIDEVGKIENLGKIFQYQTFERPPFSMVNKVGQLFPIKNFPTSRSCQLYFSTTSSSGCPNNN